MTQEVAGDRIDLKRARTASAADLVESKSQETKVRATLR